VLTGRRVRPYVVVSIEVVSGLPHPPQRLCGRRAPGVTEAIEYCRPQGLAQNAGMPVDPGALISRQQAVAQTRLVLRADAGARVLSCALCRPLMEMLPSAGACDVTAVSSCVVPGACRASAIARTRSSNGPNTAGPRACVAGADRPPSRPQYLLR